MCGINVIYNSTKIKDDFVYRIQEMNQEMQYRGPDAESIMSFDKLILGHVRLSIIGIENGEQPIVNETTSIYLVCNGEIYNYLSLKADLEKKGHVFSTNSDSEVIVHLYEEYGKDLCKYLKGMFAFVLWDTQKELLFCARDYWGKKPLYYSNTSSGLVVSSEIKTIVRSFKDQISKNKKYLSEILAFSYPITNDITPFNEVSKLPSGHFLLVSKDSILVEKYEVKSMPYLFDSSTYKKTTVDLIRESIHCRLQADVPVAVMLSGGIDSSTIAYFSKEFMQEVNVISVGYKGDFKHIDERSVAKKFSKEIGLKYHDIELTNQDFKNYFEEYLSVMNEPVADPSAFAQWAVYKKSSELGFKVLLSGNGGDEIFYGYSNFNQLGTKLNNFSSLHKYFSSTNNLKLLPYLIRFLTYNLNKINYISPTDIDKALFNNKDFSFADYKLFHNENYASFNFSGSYFHNSSNGIENVYNFLQNTWLINNCFYLGDQLGMGNSIEIRCPFADIDLFNFLQQIPLDLKFDKNRTKPLLKDVMTGKLPDYILNPQKKGFSPPYDYIIELYRGKYGNTLQKNFTHYNEFVLDSYLNKFIEKF